MHVYASVHVSIEVREALVRELLDAGVPGSCELPDVSAETQSYAVWKSTVLS